MNRTRLDAALMTLGGVGLIVGSFLGWAVLLGRNVSGIDGGDGWMCVVGAAALISFGVRTWLGDDGLPLWLGWAGLLTGIGIAGVNLLDILDTGGDDVAVGTGMKLMVVAGFAGFVGLADYSWTARDISHTK